MTDLERIVFSKTCGIFNVAQYPSYLLLFFTCYQYMYNQGAVMKKLQVQTICYEFVSKTWLITNICYCKNIIFKGTHLCKMMKKSFTPTGKLYLIKQSWLLDLRNKIFCFDLDLHTLVSTSSNLGTIYFFLVIWYHGIVLKGMASWINH